MSFKIKKNENQLIIAICGPSTSGKSTLTEQVLDAYSSKIESFDLIQMEEFFKRSNVPMTDMRGKRVQNLDLKESIKWKQFWNNIALNDSPILLIDGFILFADETAFDFVDILVTIEYNIETDYNIALERRVRRVPFFFKTKIPDNYLDDPFSSRINYFCTYFHDIVWGEMVKHPEYTKPPNWEKPILTLSATNDLQNNVQETLNFLKPYIEQHLNTQNL